MASSSGSGASPSPTLALVLTSLVTACRLATPSIPPRCGCRITTIGVVRTFEAPAS